MTNSNKAWPALTIRFLLEDDLDDDLDEEDDDISDDEEAEDEEDQGDDDEDADTETWQVSSARGFPLKAGSRLTSGPELPRLTPISQLV